MGIKLCIANFGVGRTLYTNMKIKSPKIQEICVSLKTKNYFHKKSMAENEELPLFHYKFLLKVREKDG